MVPTVVRHNCVQASAPRARKQTTAASVSLQQLVESGLLEPGEAAVFILCKGQRTFGDLMQDGSIVCEAQGKQQARLNSGGW